jgi:integrase
MPVQGVQSVELGLCARPQAPPDRTVGAGWSPAWRNDPTEYLGADVWRRIWNAAVDDAGLPFPYTPYQVRHTHASWLIDQGVDLARVQYRLGHGDLQATTRYVKILDEEDPKAADVIRRYSETLPRVRESAIRDARCSIPEG